MRSISGTGSSIPGQSSVVSSESQTGILSVTVGRSNSRYGGTGMLDISYLGTAESVQ